MRFIKWIGLSILILLTILIVLLHAIEGFANGTEKGLIKHFKNANTDYNQEILNYDGRQIRSISVEHEGNNTLICFVHGAPGCWNAFKDYMIDPELRSKANMISVDRLGYGKSDYGNVEHSIQHHSYALNTILKQKEFDELVLIGHSFGGPIVANYAALFPDNIKAVWMVSPVINPDTEKDFWFNHILKLPFVAALMPKYINVATEEKLRHADALREMEGNWAKIQAPITHLHGMKDWIAPAQGNLDYSRNYISNELITIEVWEDGGHLIPFDSFEKFKLNLLAIIST